MKSLQIGVVAGFLSCLLGPAAWANPVEVLTTTSTLTNLSATDASVYPGFAHGYPFLTTSFSVDPSLLVSGFAEFDTTLNMNFAGFSDTFFGTVTYFAISQDDIGITFDGTSVLDGISTLFINVGSENSSPDLLGVVHYFNASSDAVGGEDTADVTATLVSAHDVSAVPLPSTLGLFGVAVLGLGVTSVGRRQARARTEPVVA